ncbi:helix-turn-helix transcriptional regulator [Endozoicomonas sp. SM1973]|uniref:Helix-turn-helix transcriptional regulator n=1 Tax=Spartinivicinus marinus TaxID=2994442 RepID=A0A853I265_9GAMM|nr:helix-turn-helix transcriptional regulator [Spartinivicinus marinus]MCX4029938.1 helix-turn-helix transcriptional regulator [Spartinivicinus marinus]NYZ64818.1 helix-turn-helix transcriptional regulator [Spartinivicinus marinus]
MQQTEALITALKRQLKARGFHYSDVAQALDISEASVKRLFSEQSFSLKRLEAICQWLDISFFDLAKQTPMAESERSTQLTYEQEQALAENSLLLVYFYLLINDWPPKKIEKHYNIAPIENIKLLTTLDKLKLIELLPNNRVRRLTHRQIDWLPNGPIRKQHEVQVKEEFLKASFTTTEEHFQFHFGELSTASRNLLFRKLEKLTKEFNDLVEVDLHLPEEEKTSIGLLTASRPWVFSMVNQFKREK